MARARNNQTLGCHIQIVIASVIACICIGCQPPLDLSSDEAAVASIERIESTLSDTKKAELRSALTSIAMDVATMQLQASGLEDESIPEEVTAYGKELAQSLHGATADEILNHVDSVSSRLSEFQEKRDQVFRERRKEQALAEIGMIESAMELFEKRTAIVDKVVVTKSILRENSGAFSQGNVIEISVRNDTELTITKIQFKTVYSSPDREVPWIDTTFSYEIDGGLEPGELGDWVLEPNMFSDLGGAELREDALLTTLAVTVIDSKDEVYNIPDNIEELQGRLTELKELLG